MLVAAILCLLLAFVTPSGAATTTNTDPIRTVCVRALSGRGKPVDDQEIGLVRGLEAALFEVNRGGGINGRNLTMDVYDDQGGANRTNVNADIGARPQDYVATLMNTIPNHGNLVKALPGMPHIGPWAINPADFTPKSRNQVHLRMPNLSQMLAMAVYGINAPDLRCKRFAMVYGPFPVVALLARQMRDTLTSLGVPDTVLMTLVYQDQEGFAEQLRNITDRILGFPRIQCVIMFHRDAQSVLLESIMADPRYNNDVFLFTQGFNVESVAATGKNQTVLSNMYTVQSFPGPSDTSFLAVRNYQSALTALHSDTAYNEKERRLYGYEPPAGGYRATVEGVEGYVVGRFFADVVKRAGGDTSYSGLLNAVYNSGRVFSVDDLVFGPYTDECLGGGESETVLGSCWCNTGNKMMSTLRYLPSESRYVEVADSKEDYARISLPLSTCALDSNSIQPYYFMVLPVDVNATAEETVVKEQFTSLLTQLSQAAFKGRSARHLMEASMLKTLTTSSRRALGALEERYLFHIMAFPSGNLGSIAAESAGRYLLLGPTNLERHQTIFVRESDVPGGDGETLSVVTVMATVADMLHTSMALASERQWRVRVVVDAVWDAASLAIMSADTFNVDYEVIEVDEFTDVTGVFATDRVVVLASVFPQLLSRALVTPHATPVVLCTSDFILERLITSTNWTNLAHVATTELYVVTSLSGLVSDTDLVEVTANGTEQDAMRTMQTYATAIQMLVSAVSTPLKAPFTPTQLLDQLYMSEFIPTSFMRIGPLSRSKNCNKGATKFHVHWLPQLYDVPGAPNASSNATFVTDFVLDLNGCRINYQPRSESSDSVPTNAIIAVIIAVVALALLMAAFQKLCRSGCNMVTLRKFVQSPVLTSFMRLVFQFLDIVTDTIACYVVIERNVDTVFTTLFTILTATAFLANIFEITTTLMHIRFVLDKLTSTPKPINGDGWGGPANMIAATPPHTPSDASLSSRGSKKGNGPNPLKSGAAADSSAPVIDFQGVAMPAQDAEGADAQVAPMKVAQEWDQRLSRAAIGTLVAEDIPMCTMTTIALLDEPELVLVLSLLVSAILLGTKLIGLQEVIMRELRRVWRGSDERRLNKLAVQLQDGASAKDLKTLVGQQATDAECAVYATLLEDANPDRYGALTQLGEQLVQMLDELEVDGSEFFAIVMQTLKAHHPGFGVTGPTATQSANQLGMSMAAVSLRRKFEGMASSVYSGGQLSTVKSLRAVDSMPAVMEHPAHNDGSNGSGEQQPSNTEGESDSMSGLFNPPQEDNADTAVPVGKKNAVE